MKQKRRYNHGNRALNINTGNRETTSSRCQMTSTRASPSCPIQWCASFFFSFKYAWVDRPPPLKQYRPLTQGSSYCIHSSEWRLRRPGLLFTFQLLSVILPLVHRAVWLDEPNLHVTGITWPTLTAQSPTGFFCVFAHTATRLTSRKANEFAQLVITTLFSFRPSVVLTTPSFSGSFPGLNKDTGPYNPLPSFGKPICWLHVQQTLNQNTSGRPRRGRRLLSLQVPGGYFKLGVAVYWPFFFFSPNLQHSSFRTRRQRAFCSPEEK